GDIGAYVVTRNDVDQRIVGVGWPVDDWLQLLPVLIAKARAHIVEPAILPNAVANISFIGQMLSLRRDAELGESGCRCEETEKKESAHEAEVLPINIPA